MRSHFAAMIAFWFMSISPVSYAGPMFLYDTSYTQIVRATGQPVYPLTVDASGNIYFVTGTSTGDQVRRVNTDGSIDVVYGSTNGVIGTVADLELAFDGDLFANDGSPGGIRRFQIPTGSNGTFWASPFGQADAGMAFDASNQILYTSALERIYAIDSSGSATLVTPGRIGAGPDLGMALEPGGTLLSIHGDGIVSRIDPTAHTYTSFLDLGSILPDWQQFKSLDVNPDSGKVIFTLDVQHMPPTHRELWMMDPDGSNLFLLAEGSVLDGVDGPLNAKWGRSGDGSGAWSIYVGLNETQQIIELRPIAVPETSTLLLAVAGGVLLMTRQKLKRGN